MKHLNTKYVIYLLLGVSGVVWFCLGLLAGVDFSKFWNFMKLLPKVALIDLILITAFIKWAWRWKYFQDWLVPFPYLEGTWQGTIQSTWQDAKDGQPVAPIPCIISIKQSFTRISCVMRTAEMTSYSLAEEFRIEGENQIRQLSYSYTSKPLPSVAQRSSMHEGTVVLSMIGKPVQKLSGNYWTARKTTGEINLVYRCKEILDELPEDVAAHPMQASVSEDSAVK